jgi:hypothetical protein
VRQKKGIRIARRFLRSVRIDTDLADPKSLEGFVCPGSSAEVLSTMAHHVADTGQGAFTWTGPYGSGKSSLVVALSALLTSSPARAGELTKVFGKSVCNAMWQALPLRSRGWRIVPVIGRRESPTQVIGEAILKTGLADRIPRGGWTDANVCSTLEAAAAQDPTKYGGVVVFLDEMGKFLEGAAHGTSDVFIFQSLAELASRSGGRLLVIGILHQSFEEYASRLSRQVRDEWSKIQGRFVDLSINATGEEQIELISRAIESDHVAAQGDIASEVVARAVRRGRKASIDDLARKLDRCWPLHPVVVGLLGPISRRRFGQNQRSIFGFLSSAEPSGFQDFLRDREKHDLYLPHQLWDYLRTNLEASILASPDGHRWAVAADAIDRCEASDPELVHVQVLKTIAVLDLFKDRSGLLASQDVLGCCFPDLDRKSLQTVLTKLSKLSLIVFKKFADSYAVFAGSDFDIEVAVSDAMQDIRELDFPALNLLAGLQPILAKRHYHETGAMRWFQVAFCPLADLSELVRGFRGRDGTMGQFLLAIPSNGETEQQAQSACAAAANEETKWDVVVGLSKRTWTIVPLARELMALEQVRLSHPELVGDAVAKKEIEARVADLTNRLEFELRSCFDRAIWYAKGETPRLYRHSDMNGLASTLATRRYSQCPKLHNELLNRQKPSASAVSAQNVLLRRMAQHEDERRLGIEGFPAEGGLYDSLLNATKLHDRKGAGWRFVAPQEGLADVFRLAPMWAAATEILQTSKGKSIALSDLYSTWRAAPFGVKEGLMPLLGVAFILTQREHLAIYREGVFRSRFDDVDVDYLAKDALTIQLRWVDLNSTAKDLLKGMSDIVRDFGRDEAARRQEPIEVARGLIGIFDQLPMWTKRTGRLSSIALNVREIFKKARDPNQFLFDDLPAVLGAETLSTKSGVKSVVADVRQGISELTLAYPGMLRQLRELVLTELQVEDRSDDALKSLRDRAENVRQLAGDFHLDAFVGRLSHFNGSDESFEGIASLAANKPPRDWVDPDFDRASVNLAELSQQFLRAETFARVKGRRDKRQAIAVVIGMDGGRPTPIVREFEVADSDRGLIDDVVTRVKLALKQADTSQRNLILAALAEISTQYMESDAPGKRIRKKAAANG